MTLFPWEIRNRGAGWRRIKKVVDMEVFGFAIRMNTATGFIIAALATCVLYFVLGRKTEFSLHAIQNASASILINVANIFAMAFFVKDINRFMQSTYEALAIPTLPETFWAGVPLWAIAIMGIMARDFADYCNHRLMHTTWGWPAHAAHHSDTHVNAFTSFRVHFLESIVMTASYIVLLTWLQIPEALPIVVVFHVLHNIYVHLDVDIDHGPFKYLIASPNFHRWHHADVEVAHGKNLANVMPLWDKLFGTYYYPGVCKEEMGALKTGIEDKNPVLIYIYPFQEWARLITRAWRRNIKPRLDASNQEEPAHQD